EGQGQTRRNSPIWVSGYRLQERSRPRESPLRSRAKTRSRCAEIL
ncbi:hypothetical protein AVDCRST_MAG82-2339, partial [uncultured Rubrobacteraceae bacterium]